MNSLKHLFLVMLVLAMTTISVEAQTEKTYVVDAGGYTWLEWNFDRMTRVAAKFRARGGSRNDIEVFILDEDGFENWRNGHRVGTYYNSGRITVGRFDVNLRPGKYFLVMNNKFSAVSNKVVSFEFY
ncbi:MAG TPA: hypothetical protein VFS10_02160 [Pyrinomonadaceae bacterium]|nr:hypothetical protein [Pyrinomonadaceae bacterium]